ncbi:MAG TPA: hypothetical protein VE645_19180 [Pseudonocardiaceae bacterium]|jgi:hypothetical protein|nr:hypothetical protein [Pseudonocardiaceae bacterium]
MTDTITRTPVGEVVRTITQDEDDRTHWVETDDLGYFNSGVDWKPGSIGANRPLLEDKLEQAINFAQTQVNGPAWSAMTAAQRDTAHRAQWRIMLNLLRYVRGANSAGDGA